MQMSAQLNEIDRCMTRNDHEQVINASTSQAKEPQL